MMQAVFPNTLYLPDKARLALNSLTKIVDEESGLPYCLFDVTSEPPVLAHTCFDWSDHTARLIDALLLARTLTGCDEVNTLVEQLFKSLDTGFEEHGLHFTPDNEWTSKQANMHYQRSVINALLSLSLADHSEKAKARLVELIHGIYDIAIKREDFCYFPAVEYLPGGWFRGDWNILGYGIDPANTSGRLLFGLCRAYELTEDDICKQLARGIVNHVMHHSSAYMPDGSFSTGMEFREGHFHSRAVTLLGVIRFGYTFSDSEALNWGKKVFDKALAYGTEFGWFPERLVENRAHGCETCAVVDMMESAIWLAKSGYTEYWEIAEKILRNQLIESQIPSMDVLVEARKKVGADTSNLKQLEPFVGGFAGWSEPNDLLSKVMHNWDLYLCCCAQGVRGFYNAWTNAVNLVDGVFSINLLINYADDNIQVQSWIPNKGKIQIMPKTACSLRIRTPKWVCSSSVTVSINGASIDYICENGYIFISDVGLNDIIEIRFEILECETKGTILGVTYNMKWKGNRVEGINPKGKYIPIYNGDIAGMVPMVEKEYPSGLFRL